MELWVHIQTNYASAFSAHLFIEIPFFVMATLLGTRRVCAGAVGMFLLCVICGRHHEEAARTETRGHASVDYNSDFQYSSSVALGKSLIFSETKRVTH